MRVIPLQEYLKPFQKVSVVCHDVGGAILLNSLKKYAKLNISYFGYGPAKEIFGENDYDRNSIFFNTDLLLTGTSGISNVELNAIAEAQRRNITTISFLEHWVNYQERFTRGHVRILPDKILVSDKQALKKALETFDEDRVILVNNPYIDELLTRAKSLKISTQQNTLLYLADAEHHRILDGRNQKEPSAYQAFIKEFLTKFFIERIIVRPHPSQIQLFNLNLYKHSGLEVLTSDNKDLLHDILQYEYVAGYETLALYVASYFKKQVFSSKSLQEGKLILPASNIIQFTI